MLLRNFGNGIAHQPCYGRAILDESSGPGSLMLRTVMAILAGLFLLAFLLARATRSGVYAGIAAGSVFTIWAVLTTGAKPMLNLAPFNFSLGELTIGAFGNIMLFVVGATVSFMTIASAADRKSEPDAGTVWNWLRSSSARHAQTVESDTPLAR